MGCPTPTKDSFLRPSPRRSLMVQFQAIVHHFAQHPHREPSTWVRPKIPGERAGSLRSCRGGRPCPPWYLVLWRYPTSYLAGRDAGHYRRLCHGCSLPGILRRTPSTCPERRGEGRKKDHLPSVCEASVDWGVPTVVQFYTDSGPHLIEGLNPRSNHPEPRLASGKEPDDGGSSLNKRKRVAQQKHRVKQRKLEEKRKATRAASTLAPARPRTAESERPAPIVPASRPPVPPRRPRSPRPAGTQGQQPQEQGRPQAAGQRPAAPRPAPRRATPPQPEQQQEQESAQQPSEQEQQ